jgi:hypothetical protein
MREIHRHMDTEEAERYLMGVSREDEAAELEEHLLVCADCRERISTTDLYLSSMRTASRELGAHPGEDGRRLSWIWGGVAAGTGLAVLVLLVQRYYQALR